MDEDRIFGGNDKNEMAEQENRIFILKVFQI